MPHVIHYGNISDQLLQKYEGYIGFLKTRDGEMDLDCLMETLKEINM